MCRPGETSVTISKMKTIILLEKGNLPIQIKKPLMREGYLPLEVSDPSKVRLLAASELGINGDMMTMAALEAMSGVNSYSERAKFTERLHARIKDVEHENSKTGARILPPQVV